MILAVRRGKIIILAAAEQFSAPQRRAASPAARHRRTVPLAAARWLRCAPPRPARTPSTTAAAGLRLVRQPRRCERAGNGAVVVEGARSSRAWTASPCLAGT